MGGAFRREEHDHLSTIMTSEPLYTPTPEHQVLRETMRQFVAQEVEPQALEFDRQERFNLPLFKRLAPLGLLGITAPEEHGGAAMDPVAAVIVHEELSSSDPGFCLAYLAHSMLCVNNIAVNCNEQQRTAFLPPLCDGRAVGAMGLSEPNAGTDILSMTTTAKRDGDSYIINGRKLWITNGCLDEEGTPCDTLVLYARTGTDQNGRSEFSTFIVRGDDPGFTVGQKIMDKAGMRASNTAELCFDDCRIPRDRLIGNEGESFMHMMRNLEIERVTLAAMSLGIAKRSLEVMWRYTQDRKAFGKPLYEFGQIQASLGDSYAEYQAARSYVYNTASNLDLHSQKAQRLNSDGVKLFAAKVGKTIADRAIQALGGYGYVGEYVVERLWRDAKLLEIGGGTNEAHQKNISRDLVKLDRLPW